MSGSTFGTVESVVARLFNRRLRGVVPLLDFTPIQVTIVYTMFGFAALYVSDVFLPQAIADPVLLTQAQALKGGVEVVVTAGLIFVLTSRSRRALDERNDKLNALNAERSILYRVFRHNLRQDITVVMGYSEAIRSTTNDEEVRTHSEKVVDRAARIGRYQSYVSRIERLLEPPVTVTPTDLTDVVAENGTIADVRAADDVAIEIDVPGEALAVAVPHLDQAVDEIVENAVRHTGAAPHEIEIRIDDSRSDWIELIVSDDGPGIPEHERRTLERMEEEQLTHSSGLGLWQAKLACTVSGGDIVIPPQDDGGTVVLRLPKLKHRSLPRRLQERLW